MTSVERIKDAFPHPTVEPIIGQPAYETIKPLHQKLSADAASIVSHLGNGRLGLIYLTVTPPVYNTLSAVAFIPPVNPGATIIYPNINPTHFQIHAANATHASQSKLFQ